MQIRPGKAADFSAVQTLVAEAIAEPFYRPGLTEAQRAENRHIVDIAAGCCRRALTESHLAIFSALADGELIGFIIVDHREAELPEIDWLIVSPSYQGKGVAAELMRAALDWVGPGKPVQLGVIHFNSRAIAFYRKFGFIETGAVVGRHAIPRSVMLRPAADTRRRLF